MKPWTNQQKKIAAMACREHAGDRANEVRHLVLGGSEFNGRAFFDRNGQPSDEASSTSKKLTNRDFETFMAAIEAFNGGSILGNPEGHWERKAEIGDDLRYRYKIHAIARLMERTLNVVAEPVLEPGWLEGFVERMTSGATRSLEECDAADLVDILEGIKKWARRKGVFVSG